MEENKYELNLVLNALRMCMRPQVLLWEGGGLLVGFMCFNFLANIGLIPDSKWLVFPPLFLMGLFLLYACVATGNAGGIVLLGKEESSLTEWTDVIPTDKKFVHTIAMSAAFFALAAVLIAVAYLISLPGKWVGPAWLAWVSLLVLALSVVSIATMFQGLFMFPSFLATGVDDSHSFERFVAFLKVNWIRILKLEGLFLGIAIILSLPASAVAYLSFTFLQSVANSLGLSAGFSVGLPGIVTATLALAPLQAFCALIPTSFLTSACYLFCTGAVGNEE